MATVQVRADRLGRSQWGWARREQLQARAGVSRSSIQRLVRAGVWEEPYPGTIDLGTHAPSWRWKVAGAVIGAGPDAWASHGTAAFLHGFLDAPRPSRIDVVVPRGRWAKLGDLALHTTSSLASDEVTVRDRIPCTGRARTLLDLSATATPDDLERYLADLARRDRGIVRAVVALTDRHRRSPGRRRLLDVVARLPDGVGRLGSPLEVLGVQELVRLGAPPFALQYPVLDDDGGVVKRVDVAWPGDRTIVEFDGAAYHDLTSARAHDRAVRERLRGLGWHVEVVRRSDLGGDRLPEIVRRLGAVR